MIIVRTLSVLLVLVAALALSAFLYFQSGDEDPITKTDTPLLAAAEKEEPARPAGEPEVHGEDALKQDSDLEFLTQMPAWEDGDAGTRPAEIPFSPRSLREITRGELSEILRKRREAELLHVPYGV